MVSVCSVFLIYSAPYYRNQKNRFFCLFLVFFSCIHFFTTFPQGNLQNFFLNRFCKKLHFFQIFVIFSRFLHTCSRRVNKKFIKFYVFFRISSKIHKMHFSKLFPYGKYSKEFVFVFFVFFVFFTLLFRTGNSKVTLRFVQISAHIQQPYIQQIWYKKCVTMQVLRKNSAKIAIYRGAAV